MIDFGYPAVAVELAIDDVPGRERAAAAAAPAPCSAGAIAHHLVSEALTHRQYERAERAARVAYDLLPGDEMAALDLAWALDARGQVAQARAVLEAFATSDRSTPGRGGKAVTSMGDIGRKRRRIEVLPEREPAEAPTRAPERDPVPERPAKTPAPAAP